VIGPVCRAELLLLVVVSARCVVLCCVELCSAVLNCVELCSVVLSIEKDRNEYCEDKAFALTGID